MKNKTKTDPYTGETFEAKRRNQVFVTRQNRIDYHNEQAALLRDAKAPINTPLHRNLLVLTDLMRGKKEAVFHKEFLLGRGFSFKHNTHSEEYKGTLVFAVYGYLWLRVADKDGQLTDHIKIITR